MITVDVANLTVENEDLRIRVWAKTTTKFIFSIHLYILYTGQKFVNFHSYYDIIQYVNYLI